MTWEEVRQQYPNQWLIIDAVAWHDSGDHRHITEMQVVEANCPMHTVQKRCNELVAADPHRELYFTTTAWDTPRIKTPLVLRQARAARGSREKFLHALSKVADVEPEERDRL